MSQQMLFGGFGAKQMRLIVAAAQVECRKRYDVCQDAKSQQYATFIRQGIDELAKEIWTRLEDAESGE